VRGISKAVKLASFLADGEESLYLVIIYTSILKITGQ
jgi:preprotein translocase subunit Sec63